MATAAAMPASSVPRQNWILGPAADMAFIIAAPLVSLAVVLAALPALGLMTVWMLFTAYTVAHHFPTFLRIYGDRDLFRRFRWNFLLGPILPFAFAMAAAAYCISQRLPTQKLLYLMFIPTLWDAWHFLMQHYGFMRIYDRPNQAPRKLAARMDLAICAAWFVCIMVQAGSWLPDLLAGLTQDVALPAIQLLSADAYRLLVDASLAAALSATAVYAGYLVWCRARGYFVSGAKLWLLVIAFSVMYVTYVPLAGWLPGWSFLLGFVVMGLVHNTQYFAIVWKYNRSLARQPDPRRPKLFQRAFARGGLAVLAGYVVLCLAYGSVLGFRREIAWSSWVYGLLFATTFTSTLMHYYYDGFIWKLRHKENQQHLAMLEVSRPGSGEQPVQPIPSWWDRWREGRSLPVARTALKHGLYFGLPLAVLTAGAWAVQKTPQGDPRRYLRRAETFYQNGRLEEALRQAGLAADGLQKQLDVQQRLVEISPTASHYAGLAEVLYGRAWCRAQAEAIRQAMDVRKAGDRPARGGAANVELAATEDAVSLLRPDPAGVREAIRALERALEISGPWTNDPTKPEPDRSAPYRLLAQWYEEIGETEKARQVQAKAELKSPGAQAAVDVSSRRGDRGQ